MLERQSWRHRARTRRWAAAAAVSAAVALGMTGCTGGTGPGSPTPSPTSTTTGSTDPAAALVAFHACLRAHGVDVSDGGPAVARGEEQDPDFAAAAAACKHHLAGTSIEVANGGSGGRISEEQLAALLSYAGCMRDHGIDMPDPDPKSGAVAPEGSAGFDQESEEFQDAHTACRSRLGDAEVSEGGAS